MEKTKKTKYKGIKIVAIVIGSILIAITILGIMFIDNKNIKYDYYEFNKNIAEDDSIIVTHLSDLHFPKIEVNIDKLVKSLLNEKPNIIAITGDLIDGSATVESCGVISFIEKIKNIAPIFYVYGNHETKNKKNIAKLDNVLKTNDVTILENNSVNLQIKNIEVTMIGLRDNVDFDKKYLYDNVDAKTNYKILLAHRPEKWDNYSSQDKEFQPNLILTGHAHGGQVRFFGQGLVAPNQGLFPKYDGGIYKTSDKNCSMIVSRGIGNSVIPFRFNNKPHVPIITIGL